MNYERQPGDQTGVLPIRQYISIKQTIKRLELALIALQGIPNRLEQARDLYGSLSTQGKPPEKTHQLQKQSRSFKTSGTDSKDFYVQYFPISYNIPDEDRTRIQLKTWGHAQVNITTPTPHKNKTKPMDTNTRPPTTNQHSRLQTTRITSKTTQTHVQTKRVQHITNLTHRPQQRIRTRHLERLRNRKRQQLDNIRRIPIRNKPPRQRKSNIHRPTSKRKHHKDKINHTKRTAD